MKRRLGRQRPVLCACLLGFLCVVGPCYLSPEISGNLRCRSPCRQSASLWSEYSHKQEPSERRIIEDIDHWRRSYLLLGLCGWGLLSRSARALSQPPPFKIAGSSKPMPSVGYGTCCRESAQGQPLVTSTKAYLAAGGRLIDTAQGYGNHLDIGEAIRQSAVPREDLWVTSKVRVRACNTSEDVIKAMLRF